MHSFTHVFQILYLAILEVQLQPIFAYFGVLLAFNRIDIVNTIQVATFLFGETTKIIVGNVSFLATIKIFEDNVQFIYLEFETHVV